MVTLLRHDTWTASTPYFGTKHQLIGAGKLSCSQVGFNIAVCELAWLEAQLQRLLARLFPQAEEWGVPALLRADWVDREAWHNPPATQWCIEQPGGHILTPRLAMHLLNRLRHHPVEQGAWRLQGACFRDEIDTLPLYRQRCFTAVEYVWLGDEAYARRECAQTLLALWAQATAWDLPVELNAAQDPLQGVSPSTDHSAVDWPAAAYPLAIMLRVPDMPLLKLAGAELLPGPVRTAYDMEQHCVASMALGVERWCLALLMRHGIDPERWPQL